MELNLNLSVNYRSTSNIITARRWLESLPPVAAFDFEAASMTTAADKARYNALLSSATDPEYARQLRQKLSATGLSHPSIAQVTHLAVGTSETDAFVLIISSKSMLRLIMTFLTTATVKQIWHNAIFDFKHIYYHTRKFPIDYEDSRQLAKSIINHAENHKSNTKLKYLMGYKYGAWSVTPDVFVTENLHDENLIKYAAYDAASTFALWGELQQFLEAQ